MNQPVSIFEERFKGGHPNSLGNTIEIVDEVLADKAKLPALVETWSSEDEIVRLRVANAVKRVCIEQPDWIATFLDQLLNEVSKINQASTQWTLAKLFEMLEGRMTGAQRQRALEIMQRNLTHHEDWIVLNNSMETLGQWAERENDLRTWLLPHLERLSGESRKSVARRAQKWLEKFGGNQ